ncbi:hypothetical protein GCM10017600_02210 [Streptosporangium carneum]|uniref:DUF11 domain-containing protein n=1 Tax=Streptosporangium carneum TaxID=47481 RepID=A0A9W6HW10_9ACTN|nr:hypothetical protein GCM10017600_02210 [Streptosporangium carneum]
MIASLFATAFLLPLGGSPALADPPPAFSVTADPPPATSAVLDPPPVISAVLDPPPVISAVLDPPPVISAVLDPPPVISVSLDPPPAVPVVADPPPAISVSLDDGVRRAAPGSESVYTLRIVNQGATALEGVTLAQTLPSSLIFVSADAGGRVQEGKVSWTVDVPAKRETVVHLSVRVGVVAAGETPNLATTACARRGGGPVLVCATDIDTLVPEKRSPRWLLPVSLLAGGGLAVGVFLVRRRRHRRRRQVL